MLTKTLEFMFIWMCLACCGFLLGFIFFAIGNLLGFDPSAPHCHVAGTAAAIAFFIATISK